MTHSYTAHWTAFTMNARTLQIPNPRKKTARPPSRYAFAVIANVDCLCVNSVADVTDACEAEESLLDSTEADVGFGLSSANSGRSLGDDGLE